MPVGHFLLWMFTGGRGEARMLDQTIELGGDTGMLIAAGVKVQALANEARPLEVIAVPFDCYWRGDQVFDARPYLNPDKLTFTLPGHVEMSLYASMGTLNIGQQILRSRAKTPADLGDLEAQIQIMRVMYMLRQSLDHPRRGIPSKPPMRRAYVQLIDKQNHPEKTIADIARHVGLSVTHFGRQFRAEFGASPMRVLTRERMASARQLLLMPEFRIGEIARVCGYASSQYFCRVFKAEHGLTPGAYREKHMEEGV